MLHLDRLLIPSTFSIRSMRVKNSAARLAGATGAAVHLLYDEEDDSTGDREFNWPDRARVVENVVTDEMTVSAVIDYCERESINAVVTGTNGRWSLMNRTPTALATGLIRRADQPILRVPVMTEKNDEVPRKVDRMLVPIDFSDYAATALEHARELAAVYDAALLLYFVAEEHTVAVFSDAGVPSISTLKADPEIVGRAGEALQQLYSSTGGPETEVSFHVGHGVPGRSILEFARDQSVDLIVMATHGLTGHQPFALGSVTERVVRRTDRPIFVLKAFGNSLIT
jgi:nucleotide-binding universal stress UspA family protein